MRIPTDAQGKPARDTITLQRLMLQMVMNMLPFVPTSQLILLALVSKVGVKFAGNGPEFGYNWVDDIGLTQMSNFFRVTADDSIRSLQNYATKSLSLVKEKHQKDLQRVLATATIGYIGV